MKVAAVLLNFFIPGVGSLVIGKTGSGITQLLLYFFGWVFTATLIGAIIGIPMVIAAWIWGLVTAATFDEQTANPVQVHIVHSAHGAHPTATSYSIGSQPHASDNPPTGYPSVVAPPAP